MDERKENNKLTVYRKKMTIICAYLFATHLELFCDLLRDIYFFEVSNGKTSLKSGWIGISTQKGAGWRDEQESGI